jgi:hypothetical protein
MMDAALLISGMALSALASGAVTLAYCRARTDAIWQSFNDELEGADSENQVLQAKLDASNLDASRLRLSVECLQFRLAEIHKATVNSKNGTAIMVAKMSGTTPERKAIRDKAKDMAVGMGRDDLAGRLA